MTSLDLSIETISIAHTFSSDSDSDELEPPPSIRSSTSFPRSLYVQLNSSCMRVSAVSIQSDGQPAC